MRRTNTPTREVTSRGFTSYLRTHCRNVYKEKARSHAHESRGDGWKVQKEESWRGNRRREINVREGIDWPNCESRGKQRGKKASLVDWLVHCKDSTGLQYHDMMALCSLDGRQVNPNRSTMGQTSNTYLLTIKLHNSKTVRLFH